MPPRPNSRPRSGVPPVGSPRNRRRVSPSGRRERPSAPASPGDRFRGHVAVPAAASGRTWPGCSSPVPRSGRPGRVLDADPEHRPHTRTSSPCPEVGKLGEHRPCRSRRRFLVMARGWPESSCRSRTSRSGCRSRGRAPPAGSGRAGSGAGRRSGGRHRDGRRRSRRPGRPGTVVRRGSGRRHHVGPRHDGQDDGGHGRPPAAG